MSLCFCCPVKAGYNLLRGDSLVPIQLQKLNGWGKGTPLRFRRFKKLLQDKVFYKRDNIKFFTVLATAHFEKRELKTIKSIKFIIIFFTKKKKKIFI